MEFHVNVATELMGLNRNLQLIYTIKLSFQLTRCYRKLNHQLRFFQDHLFHSQTFPISPLNLNSRKPLSNIKFRIWKLEICRSATHEVYFIKTTAASVADKPKLEFGSVIFSLKTSRHKVLVGRCNRIKNTLFFSWFSDGWKKKLLLEIYSQTL